MHTAPDAVRAALSAGFLYGAYGGLVNAARGICAVFGGTSTTESVEYITRYEQSTAASLAADLLVNISGWATLYSRERKIWWGLQEVAEHHVPSLVGSIIFIFNRPCGLVPLGDALASAGGGMGCFSEAVTLLTSPHHHSWIAQALLIIRHIHYAINLICVMPFTVAGTLHVFTGEVSESIARGHVNSIWKMLQFPVFWSMVGSQWPAWFVFGVLRRYVGKYWSRQLLNPLRAIYYAAIAAWYIKIRHSETRVTVLQDGLCMEQAERATRSLGSTGCDGIGGKTGAKDPMPTLLLLKTVKRTVVC